MHKLTDFLTIHGLTRDDLKLFWAQVVSGAGLVVSGALNIPQIGTYLGLHISDTTLHWITAMCAIILWSAGKLSTSPLFGKPPTPPVNP